MTLYQQLAVVAYMPARYIVAAVYMPVGYIVEVEYNVVAVGA